MDLNVIVINIKLLEKIGLTFHSLRFGNGFSGMIPKAQATKEI